MIKRSSWALVLPLLVAIGCGDDASTSTGGTGQGGAGQGGSSQGGAGQGGSGQGGMVLDSSVGVGASGQGGTADSSSSVGGQGGSSGQGMVDSRLVGTWRPTQFSDSGNPPMPASPNDPFFVFNDDGTFAFGCGNPSSSTWTYTEGGPSPAIGVIDVLIGGSSMVSWYVTELTANTLVFAEGGDLFYFEAATCP
jgi:hypothetical protein